MPVVMSIMGNNTIYIVQDLPVRNIQFSIWIINIITTTTAFIYKNTVRIK